MFLPAIGFVILRVLFAPWHLVGVMHIRENNCKKEDSAQANSCVSISDRAEFLLDLYKLMFSFISPRELAWLLLSDKVSWLLGNPESSLKLNLCTCIDLDLAYLSSPSP